MLCGCTHLSSGKGLIFMLNRIFLSADIEGTCGIAHWDETELGTTAHEPFRHPMTREVAAA